MTVADSVSEQARTRPDHPALIKGEQVVTYAELDGLVRRTAAHLIARGARPGDRIGLCLTDSADHVAAMLAVMRIGGIIVPMDWRARQAEKSALVDRFDIGLIVATPGRGPRESSAVVEFDDAWREAVQDAAPFENAAVDADGPMIVNLSSGTTAAAKGAVVSHRQYAVRLANYRANFGDLSARRYLSVLPLCFSGGRNHVLAHLQDGGTAVLHGSMFGRNEFPDLVARYDITATFVAPQVIRWLLDMPVNGDWLLPGMQCLVSGADAITAEEKEAVVGRVTPHFFETYSTAMTGQLTCLRPDDIADRAASVGRINPGIEIEIVDDEDQPLAPGQAGHMRCRGEAISTGFYPAQAATAAQGFRDGWFYPGDLARLDDENYLYLTGRAADLIVRQGITLDPAEIEAVLREHPAVADVAVVARPDGAAETAVVAVAVARGTLDPDDLRAFCRGRLTVYKHPDDVVLVDALPRTAAGKIKRGEVARLIAATDS